MAAVATVAEHWVPLTEAAASTGAATAAEAMAAVAAVVAAVASTEAGS
jgi:hypothetical protein